MSSRGTLVDLSRSVRQRFAARNVVIFAAVLAFVYWFTGNVNTVIGIAIALTLAETVHVLGDTPSIDDRWIGLGIGTVITLVSLVWFAYELTSASNTGGPVWFPALTALGGVWYLLDARTGGHTYGNVRDDDMAFNELMTVMNHFSLVVDELKDGTKTVNELADACDLTESRVREAVAVGTDDGAIYSVDSSTANDETRYTLDESKIGPVAFVRQNGKRLLSSLGRPFR